VRTVASVLNDIRLFGIITDLIRKILLLNILLIWMLITALPPIQFILLSDTLNETTFNFRKKNIFIGSLTTAYFFRND
jgi:hypothetical protein